MDKLCSEEAAEIFTGGLLGYANPATEKLLEAASAVVRRYCGWWIAGQRTQLVSLPGTGKDRLVLPYPAIQSVYVENAPEATYRLHGPSLVRTDGGIWSAGAWFDIQVTAGYEMAEIPDVCQVVATLAKRMFETQGSGLISRQVGAVHAAWSPAAANGGLLPGEMDTLAPYKIGARA